MARPKFEPGDKDAASVEAMVAYGIPQENIALVIGCDAKTLRKYFRREIDTGATKMIAKVGEANRAGRGLRVVRSAVHGANRPRRASATLLFGRLPSRVSPGRATLGGPRARGRPTRHRRLARGLTAVDGGTGGYGAAGVPQDRKIGGPAAYGGTAP